jgi:hypothetical protein
LQKEGRTWRKIRRKSFENREIDEQPWLLDRQERISGNGEGGRRRKTKMYITRERAVSKHCTQHNLRPYEVFPCLNMLHL